MTDFTAQKQVNPEKADANAPDAEFVRQVRGAMAHLYDQAYLQNHPLVASLGLAKKADQMTRAQGVRQALLECITMLQPDTPEHGQAEAARAYAILTYRYVEGVSMEEIAERLVLSRRQAYREHRKGVAAVASLVWDKVRKGRVESQRPFPIGRDGAQNRLEVAQAEVDRLQQAVEADTLDLQEILKQVLTMLQPLAQQAGIKIEVVSPDTWPPIVADRVMLRQALLNVLSNALNAVRGDLVITATQNRQKLVVAISEGLPEAQIPSSRPVIKRDGVGLTVAKSLIEAQAGRLELGIDDEDRWWVQISLPISGSATVLVIDDNADLVALFQRYLAGHEITVIGATDGEQALHLAVELQPQVITLDVMMPHQDGWEILQQLKRSSDTKHIPVVICSILNEPQLAHSEGASDYMLKPVDQAEFLDVLQRYLGPLLPNE